MAGDGVLQDSKVIRRVAGEIRGDKREFLEAKDKFFDYVKNGITKDDTGDSAWFGPSADGFATDIKNQEGTFDTVAENMEVFAKGLDDHADVWDDLEK